MVNQVLQKRWGPTFSDHGHGFRPGRSARQAVRQAQQYNAEGCRWVVDLDLENFFDQVNPDRLIATVAKRVAGPWMLQLIGAFLKAGVLENGLVAVDEGTPQGGPLPPLLSNLMLDELDRELAGRVICERLGPRAMLGAVFFQLEFSRPRSSAHPLHPDRRSRAERKTSASN